MKTLSYNGFRIFNNRLQTASKALATFDLVIYDMPPLLGISDAYFLAPQTDGLLMVVRLHQLKRAMLEQTMDELRVPAVPILGSVANASEESLGPASYLHSDFEMLTHSPIANLKEKVTLQSKQLIERFQHPNLPR